jgi:hypothetical protein
MTASHVLWASCAIFALLGSWVLFVEIPRRTIHNANAAIQLADAVNKRLRACFGVDADVTIRGRFFHEASGGVRTLPIIEYRFWVEHPGREQWGDSAVRIQLVINYVAEVGIDMAKGCWVDVNPAKRRSTPRAKVRICLPQAELLSFRQTSLQTGDSESAWEAMPDHERDRICKSIRQKALSEIGSGPLIAEAQLKLEEKLREALKDVLALGNAELELEFAFCQKEPPGAVGNQGNEGKLVAA